MKDIWQNFLAGLEKYSSELIKEINPPATEAQLEKARTLLGPLFHPELEELYKIANGFAPGAYLLRDDYRILPLEEMIEKSLAIIGTTVPTDFEAGEYTTLKKLKLLVFAIAKEEDEDVEQVSISIKRGKTDISLWYKEGGIHDFEEVVSTSETLKEWLTVVVEEYYA